jgi:predicted double-glycine peptidase
MAGPQPAIVVDGQLVFSKNLKTWKDVVEYNIVMQKFDYSCGPAAMATLMTYYFQDEVTEREILLNIVSSLSAEEFENRKDEGLSLLDLKQYAEQRGYQAVGIRLEVSSLPKLRGPVLVYLETADFKHFAILRGIREDRVYIADPSRGNVRMSISDFIREWPGIALAIGKEGFGAPSNYPLALDYESPFRPELQAARRNLYLGF